MNKTKIAVLGGGSWATALVKILSEKDVLLSWWVRNKENAEFIRQNKRNPNYLSDVLVNPEKVTITSEINTSVMNSEYILLAIPSAFLKNTLTEIDEKNLRGKKVISAIKGIVPENNQIICEFLNKNFHLPYSDLLIITGPCHAEEVALEKLSYLTVSCKEVENAVEFSKFLSCRYIKTQTSSDIYGTEYAAVLKNIYAIASGIAHGLHYGDNYQAVLISNAIQEIKRFIDIVHPIKRDIKDSAYLGDLLVTAYSQFSRNRTLGNMIGKGYSVKSALLEMNMIAEGYYGTRCIYQLNQQYKVNMPIAQAVYHILYDKTSPTLEFTLLSEKLR